VPDPERFGSFPGERGGRASVLALPDVGERRTVGHGQWVEDAVSRKGADADDRRLRELLDEAEADPRAAQRGLDSRAQLLGRTDDRAGAAALAVRRADKARHADHLVRRRDYPPTGLRHACVGEALALAQLR